MARAAVSGTKWDRCLMHFWDTGLDFFDQFIGFGRDVPAKKLLQLDRKIPEAFVLGAIIDDR